MDRLYGQPNITSMGNVRDTEQDSESAGEYLAPMADPTDLGERIRAALRHRGWSIARLERETKLSRSTINDVLRGVSKEPEIPTLAPIADALRVPLDYLRPTLAKGALTIDEIEQILLSSAQSQALDPPYGPADRLILESLGTTMWIGNPPTAKKLRKLLESLRDDPET